MMKFHYKVCIINYGQCNGILATSDVCMYIVILILKHPLGTIVGMGDIKILIL